MEIVDRRIPLSQIGKTVGPGPVQRFLRNVRRHGVVVPVLLQEVAGEGGEIEYRVIDGNRRVAAARKAGFHDVPARVFIGISDDQAARLTLAGNNFRSENDITEFWAIKHLERSGVARQRIAADAGMTFKSLELRNRWSTLDRRIFVGYANGRISATVARKISRLPHDDQRSLGDLFAVRGRLQTDDIEEFYRPLPELPPSPVYNNDVPLSSASSASMGSTPLESPHPTNARVDSPARNADLSPQCAAPPIYQAKDEETRHLDVEHSSSLVTDLPAQTSHEEHLTSAFGPDLYRPSTIPDPLLEAAHQVKGPDQHPETSVRILTGPVHSPRPRRSGPVAEGIDAHTQRVIDNLARLGCSKGIDLDDMVKALTLAYRNVEFATKLTKEVVGGRDHQS